MCGGSLFAAKRFSAGMTNKWNDIQSRKTCTRKRTGTMISYSVIGSRMLKAGGALALAVVMLAGCTSKQDQPIETAKKQAAATGQAQQVVSVDKDGNTTTTTVQPPANAVPEYPWNRSNHQKL